MDINFDGIVAILLTPLMKIALWMQNRCSGLHAGINLQHIKRFCVTQGLIRTSHTRLPAHPFYRYHETYAGELIASMLNRQESVHYAP